MKVYPFLLIFLLLLSSLAPAFAEEFNIAVLKEGDSGREVLLRRGDILLIVLREVKTAGFQWEVVELDTSKLLFLRSDSLKLSPPGALGGAELRIFTFKAVSPGRTPIRLIYRRSWESFSYPQKLFMRRSW